MSNPSSAFRSSYLYVQRRTRRRLHLIAGVGSGKTADEVADNLLNEIIESKYPSVIRAEKEIAKLENALAEELRKSEHENQN